MKKRSLFALIFAGFLICSSCEDIASVEEQAEKAAAEACECIKNKSVSTCKDQLNDDYGHYANNEDFIRAFNSAQKCGITIYKE